MNRIICHESLVNYQVFPFYSFPFHLPLPLLFPFIFFVPAMFSLPPHLNSILLSLMPSVPGGWAKWARYRESSPAAAVKPWGRAGGGHRDGGGVVWVPTLVSRVNSCAEAQVLQGKLFPPARDPKKS